MPYGVEEEGRPMNSMFYCRLRQKAESKEVFANFRRESGGILLIVHINSFAKKNMRTDAFRDLFYDYRELIQRLSDSTSVIKRNSYVNGFAKFRFRICGSFFLTFARISPRAPRDPRN